MVIIARLVSLFLRLLANLIVLCGWPERTVRRYDLRVHSLRYYFRTQLTSLSCNPEYAEFMMGHKGPLYNDIRSKGVEFLRDMYRRYDLNITPKPKASKLEQAKALVRGMGLDPEKVLREEAFSEPHRTLVTQEEWETDQAQVLFQALRKSLLAELKSRAT